MYRECGRRSKRAIISNPIVMIPFVKLAKKFMREAWRIVKTSRRRERVGQVLGALREVHCHPLC